MAYPDSYSTNLGDGLVRHFDYGQVYYRRNGVWLATCERCERLVPEDDLNDKDICPECVAEVAEIEEDSEEEG